MITKITFISEFSNKEILFETFNNAIEIPYSNEFKSNNFDLKIEFNSSIKKIRLPNFSWSNLDKNIIIPQFCSQILQLENGFYVQSETIIGIWEFDKKQPNILFWRFNPTNAATLTHFSGEKNYKSKENVPFLFPENKKLKLLFSEFGAIEISRSEIPFSAITCFTDHCDFDTLENLQLQRQFFKEKNIKITKGFFLNHFSKRENNASYQNNASEIDLWKADGHELCYHSLSQSIKSKQDSFADFDTFKPPFNEISVWIDHGFQPYNLSLYKKNNISNKDFENQLISKNITTLWNYIDSGTATFGVINQLDNSQFTLEKYIFGIRNFSAKSRLIMIYKNIIFHIDNNEFRIRNYIDSITSIKNIVFKRKFSAIFEFVRNTFPLFLLLFKTIFKWNSIKKQPYKRAKYCPIIFEYKLENQKFYVFQTLEMIDFKKGMHPKNIDLLIKNSGIFIAHTYFSANMSHYSGKFFKSENKIDEQVAENFDYLSQQIQTKLIWNPTLSELIAYWKMFHETVFEIDTNGKIQIANASKNHFRVIN